MHEIVQHQEGMTIISLFWEGRFLPLTKKGDQEIVLGIATRETIEQILAEIKYAVKIGKLDSHLGHQNTQIASG
jgi:S-adenosylmethionine synthetase